MCDFFSFFSYSVHETLTICKFGPMKMFLCILNEQSFSMNVLWNLHGKCAVYETLPFHMNAHHEFYIKLILK